MKVAVLGSGSRGNAVAFTAGTTTLLLDAGFPARVLAWQARRVGVELDRLAAVVLTHEHGDHARGAARIARAAGCPVYASAGTLSRLRGRWREIEVRPLAHLAAETIGPFTMTPCHVPHDALEPLAFAVVGPEGEKVGLAHDLGRATTALRLVLRGAGCLIVEANHDEALLGSGPYPAAVRRRIAGPAGHLSNRAAAELVRELWHPALEMVVLAHLSETCNRPALAREAARAALGMVGFRGALVVADQHQPLGPFEVRPPSPSAPAGPQPPA